MRFLKGFYIRLKKFNLILFKFNNLYYYNNKNFFFFFYRNFNFYKLIYPFFYRYNWVHSYENINYFFINQDNNFFNYQFIQLFSQTNFSINEIDEIINNIINCKNISGFIKKNNTISSSFFNKKLDFFFNEFNIKKNFDESSKINNFTNFKIQNFYKNFFYNKEYDFYSSKNFEFKKKYKNTIKLNRLIFNFFLKKRIFREFKFNKFFKKTIKLDYNNFLYLFNFNLNFVLIQSNFFSNSKDIDFFIKNRFIYVNDKIATTSNLILTKYDIIKISYNQYYYLYHRFFLNRILNNLLKLNNKLNYLNKLNNINTKIPNWIYNIIFFKEGVPKFLEIDYLTMSIVVLFNSVEFFNLNFFILKFLNVYLNRLYNWRYII